MGGKTLDPNNLKDAVMASVLEGVRQQIREKVGNIRDPDTGEFPTIVIRGSSLDDLKIQVEGSPAVIALVNERLGLESMSEAGAVPESQPHVFISYTSEDIDIARRVAEALQGAGIEVWWDKWCISSGDSLRQKIDEGIGGCTHFLALLTPRSIKKPWVNQEMDAGLIRKLNDQCRFLPVRHELPASELPPLLSGIASASITTDADIAQLINDIYALTRKPPKGPVPAAVQNSQASQTGYSAAANTVARYFVEKSEDGLFGDPMCDVDVLAREVGLSVEDTEDSIHELSGFLRLSNDHVLVEGSLFAEFDRYWKTWKTADDALRLAADIMSDPAFPSNCEEIGARYQWEPRRLNSTVYYLLERSLIVDYKGIGTAPWAVFRIVGNQNMRRFVKSRS
jgi:hypothetical protein